MIDNCTHTDGAGTDSTEKEKVKNTNVWAPYRRELKISWLNPYPFAFIYCDVSEQQLGMNEVVEPFRTDVNVELLLNQIDFRYCCT